MLESLHIRNLAVVAALDVEFGPGLNAVTGETGAGKSLILGALQLLLGGRASPAMIRRDAAQCEISAVLRLPAALPATPAVRALLDGTGIAWGGEDDLLLRRVVTPAGSRHYVNGTPVPLQFLRDLGEQLVDIHGPHDHQSLLHPACQLSLLDGFAGNAVRLDACRDRHAAWRAAAAALAAAESDHLNPAEAEFARFQLAEIDSAALAAEEDADLGSRHAQAAHARRLAEIAAQVRGGLNEADGAICEQLGAYQRLLDEMAGLDAAGGAEFASRLEEAFRLLQDLAGDLERYADHLELDDAGLARLEERLGILQKLKRKYGPTLEDVLATAARLREKLDTAERREERLQELRQAVAAAAKQHLTACHELGTARKPAAGRLADAVTDKLRRLGFAQACFEVRLTAADPGPAGTDAAEFLFAPNPGENLLPLRQIASSGEMARVMLAIKTILSHADQVPVLIFDEVDANIGGRVAVTVAAELRAISDRHQVLCITHLPQIAAAAARHYRVNKEIVDGRTWAGMTVLTPAEREAELTRMLGAEAGSMAAQAHARELLAHGAAPAVPVAPAPSAKRTRKAPPPQDKDNLL
jgi:DNA repair protein RecN (Recombination protein N)